jgi:very-short-patch-repair endonuclease
MFICHKCWQTYTNNPIERPIVQVLTKRKYVYTYNKRHGKFRPDFTFPLLKLRIDVDGLKWHRGKPAGVDTPGSREYTLSRNGWRLVHIQNGPRLVRRFLKAIYTNERYLLSA